MTEHIHSLKPGDSLAIKGPIPKFPYKANEFEELGMIAGGTGITPMWQVIQAIANDKSDKTKVTLVYTNKSEADILLREKFDDLQKNDARFKIVYGLDQLPKGFNGFTGYVTPEIISEHMPAPGKADKIKLFICGECSVQREKCRRKVQ
jgi:cytochrome-b5 reductase